MSELSFDDLDGDSLPQSGNRLQILSHEEYELLWGFPRFTQGDRDLFFTLTAPEREALEQRRSLRTKVHFLLHQGYFRARQRFFRFELPAVRDDVDYLHRRYFDDKAVADLTVSDHTRKRHVEAILGLFRYRFCALEERLLLETHARQAARISSRPVYVLRELVDLLRRERVVLPGYTILQNMVRAALAFERKRLAGALQELIEAAHAKSVEHLLADHEGQHQITTIKRQPRDFSYQQLLAEIERGEQLRALFTLSERVIARLNLSIGRERALLRLPGRVLHGLQTQEDGPRSDPSLPVVPSSMTATSGSTTICWGPSALWCGATLTRPASPPRRPFTGSSSRPARMSS